MNCRIDMYWDGSEKPAVSAPIGDFFGIAHGLIAQNMTMSFSAPDRSTLPFPCLFVNQRLATVTIESQAELWLWHDINYTPVDKLPKDAMYFHAYWHQDLKQAWVDFEIMPEFMELALLGTNIRVVVTL